jgi:hypothetical protein
LRTSPRRSFFVMLGKKLAEVLEALSQLLHLEQVFATADLIREIFDAFFDSTNPSGLHATLTRAKEGSEAFFPTALGKVDDYLKQVISTLDPGPKPPDDDASVPAGSTGIGRLRGMGATPHTVLAAAPKHDDSGQPPSSLAVQGMWGIHQARQHAEAAAPANQLASPDNPFAALVENFIRDQRLSDPSTPLGKVLADARRQFSTSFTVQSPDEFFRLALSDLLKLVRITVAGTLELVQKFIDTLLESIDAIVEGLRNVGELSIPILSPLWEAKFGKPLTFLDLLAFVAAIPVTLLYRIIEGRYPAEDRLLEGTDGPRLVLNRVAGLTSAAAGIAAGVFTAYVDAARIFSGGFIVAALTLPQRITGGVLMGTEVTLTLYEGTTSPSAALASAATFMTIGVDEAAANMPEIAALFNSVLSMWLIVMFIYAFRDPLNEQDWKEFTRNLLKTIPGLVGPAKFASRATPLPYVAPGADFTCFLAAAGLTVATTVERWDGEDSRPGRRE